MFQIEKPIMREIPDYVVEKTVCNMLLDIDGKPWRKSDLDRIKAEESRRQLPKHFYDNDHDGMS